MVEARVAFMRFCPFFCYYYYDQLEEYPTLALPTLATDARRVFINPDYMMGLTPLERCFALAHEVSHVILRDPQRMRFYAEQKHVRGLPFDGDLANRAMDYRINAHLVEESIGACNPNWLFDEAIKGDALFEDVYKKLYQPPPPPPVGPGGTCDNPGGGQGNQPPTNGSGGKPGDKPPSKTYGDNHKGSRPDKTAGESGGRFDEVLPPQQDPATGKEDVPSETEFNESVARAAAAAKAIGKMPGSFHRMVADILEPQVQWRDHIRMLLTGKLGQRRETWNTPNRRRIVLNPAIYLPGRRGHGCEDVTVVVDNSGSIRNLELRAFFSEISAILADCKPKLVRVIWCDMEVRRVEEARCLDEVMEIRVKGSIGGGGTDFRPPFAWLAERGIIPDALIYLTDMLGPFPTDPKVYPTVWCATTDIKGPFGETVHIGVAA